MIKYRSDDSADNIFIDGNLKKLWKKDEKEKLTPLRKWEEEDRYQVTTSYTLSNSEKKKIFVLLIPCLLFSIIAVAIMVVDGALYHYIDIVKTYGNYGIRFQGN